MSSGRIGRSIRALRRHANLTQQELGRRVGCSGSVISRLERGNPGACSVATLERVVQALGARLVMFIDWRGGEMDRLLDADHAALQERWAERRSAGGRWVARQEVTYNVYGDRGSIDDLAFDPVSGCLLVSELKTGIYDVQRMLAKLDEKERLAAQIARARLGWDARSVASCLVVADTRTNRRRVNQHTALFARFALRGRAAAAWLADPQPSPRSLLLFLPLSNLRGAHGRRAGRQRVRHFEPTSSVNAAPPGQSGPQRPA